MYVVTIAAEVEVIGNLPAGEENVEGGVVIGLAADVQRHRSRTKRQAGERFTSGISGEIDLCPRTVEALFSDALSPVSVPVTDSGTRL